MDQGANETSRTEARLAALEKAAAAVRSQMSNQNAKIVALAHRLKASEAATAHQFDAMSAVVEALARIVSRSSAARTEQERLWRELYGVKYIMRNAGDDWRSTRLPLWRKVTQGITLSSALEIGCNIGLNLHALRAIAPDATLCGVELHPVAAELARTVERATIVTGSILDFEADKTFDLVFSRGVLIHVSPDELTAVFEKMASHSHRYVFLAEHDSEPPEADAVYPPPTFGVPETASYLFRQDFAAAFRAARPEFSVIGEWAWPEGRPLTDRSALRCTLMKRQ